jgi:putative membrane protein
LISLRIFVQLRNLVDEGKISDGDEGRVNDQLNVLVTAITSCERLLTTRMPSAFIMQLRTILFIWLCTLPFVLVRALGPEVAMFAHFAVTWGLLGIEAAAQTCEQPFGYEYNDLPLNRLCDELCKDIDSTAKSAHTRANARLKEVANI